MNTLKIILNPFIVAGGFNLEVQFLSSCHVKDY